MADFSATAAVSPGEMDLEETITASIQQAADSGSVGSLSIAGVEVSAPSGLSFRFLSQERILGGFGGTSPLN